MRSIVYKHGKPTQVIRNSTAIQSEENGNNLPFEIHTLGWIEKNRKNQDAIPHKHSFYEIIWIKKGKGTHYIDLKKHDVKDNMVYCLTPGQVHQLNVDKNTEGYVICFNAEFLYMAENNYNILLNTGLFHDFTKTSVIKVRDEMTKEMDSIISQMLKEFENFFLLRSESLKGLLKIFLVYLNRQYDEEKNKNFETKNTLLVKRFMNLLEKHFATKKMVSDYASDMAVTPNYLNEIVKKVSGFSASYHIQQRVVLEAKRLAYYSDVNMKEIAYGLGFEDIAHFSKYFKNVAGASFTDFKKDLQYRI